MQSDIKISAIRARAVSAPLARPITTAKVSIPKAPLVLIDMETDSGITGRAYIFAYTPVTLKPLVSIIDELAALLVGEATAPVAVLENLSNRFRLLGKQGLLGMAMSGLDMALWDVLGKAHAVPVARLLGGTASPVAAYDSHGAIDPKRDASLLEASLKQGFRAIKIKIGAGDFADDVKTVAGVREIIGADVRLMVDYNQSLTVPDAIHRIGHLADFDVYWIEEPVPAEDLGGHERVRRATGARIQTGENWWFPEDAARAIAAKASDFAMLDLMKIGGITGWMRAAGHAAGASLPVSSHLFIEASAHVLPATPGAHYLEYLDIAGALLADPVAVKDGTVTAKGPGLGLEWDEKVIATCAV